MKKTLLFILAIIATSAVSAQQADTVKYWKRTGIAGLNMSQVSLSNWSAGGDPSVSVNANFAYSLDYKKDRNLWNNRLELAYGQSKTSSLGTRKTDDKIYFSSNYGYKLGGPWYASAFITYTSQFDNGYNYAVSAYDVISTFMAPGYLTAGLGFTCTPTKWLTINLSPAAWRGTFVIDDDLSDAGAFGVEPGENLKSEFGANAIAEAKYEFLPNMTVYSRLTLYSNYLGKPLNVDMNWDTQLAMKINKWFSANLSLSMIYDDDTKILQKDGTSNPALQIKEVLGVGLQVAF